MPGLRKILHLEVDAFFCAVEESLRRPDVGGQAVRRGQAAGKPGVVASCSYPARRLGIHSAMPMSQAVRLCPRLIIVPARHSVYAVVSRQVMGLLRALTPLVEQISIDEAFLDVSERPEPAEQIARRLQAAIRGARAALAQFAGRSKQQAGSPRSPTTWARTGRDDRGEGPPNAIQVVLSRAGGRFPGSAALRRAVGRRPKPGRRLAELGIHHDWRGEQPGLRRTLLRRFGKNRL